MPNTCIPSRSAARRCACIAAQNPAADYVDRRDDVVGDASAASCSGCARSTWRLGGPFYRWMVASSLGRDSYPDPIDLDMEVSWGAPSYTCFLLNARPAGQPRETGVEVCNMHAITPESRRAHRTTSIARSRTTATRSLGRSSSTACARSSTRTSRCSKRSSVASVTSTCSTSSRSRLAATCCSRRRATSTAGCSRRKATTAEPWHPAQHRRSGQHPRELTACTWLRSATRTNRAARSTSSTSSTSICRSGCTRRSSISGSSP